MTAKEKVLNKHKNAYAYPLLRGTWAIDDSVLGERLGNGATEDEAWEDALRRLEGR